jgi:hypothetical protein
MIRGTASACSAASISASLGASSSRRELVQVLQAPGGQLGRDCRHLGGIAAGMRQARYQAGCDRITHEGIVLVAANTARAVSEPEVTMTSTLERTNSAASD